MLAAASSGRLGRVPPGLRSYPCPLCQSNASHVVLRKRGTVIASEFTIVRCTACTHVRVDPRLPDEALEGLYDEAYYRGEGFDRSVSYDRPPTPAMLAEYEAILDTVAEARGGSVRGARWLDVGCGAGGLLEAARRRGADVFGSDSSGVARAACAAKGLTVLGEEALAAQRGSFDVVTAVEVIEHVPDPPALVAFLASCARVGGVIFVRTGNWNLVSREPSTPYVMPEGHIQFFTPVTMRRLFHDASLDEAKVFNRTWFVDRLMPRRARRFVPTGALRGLAWLVGRVAPGVGPFPVAVRRH
ncbi:MAG: 3-demethylubiquinone-9 3-methyltransferase [Labilithrix sp.]|nr:3-demethylubiquinone-9 3-methyltransferase [Labilithrix sp.]